MQEHPEQPPEWDDQSTPESRAAWKAFYESESVTNAQARYTAREQELQPLRDFYNNEVTRAKIQFQQETHEEMLKLTEILRELDQLPKETGKPVLLDVDGAEHPGS